MKLSIITINYNNVADLIKTIESVIMQTWEDFEYIIIDGGSVDGSLQEIKRYENRLSYWVSEPDKGVFNAMNKGIDKASGEYLLMLNAGDYLSNNEVLGKVFGLGYYNEDLLIGDVYRAANGKIFDKSFFPNILTFNFFKKGSISHQGTFIRRELHHIIGKYDESFKFVSDWKFFILAICKYNVSYRHLSLFTTVCDCGGLTCSPANFPSMKRESELVLKLHFPALLDNEEELHNETLKWQLCKLGQKVKVFLRTVLKIKLL